MRLTLIQDKQLPSGALNQRSDGESQAHAVAIAGQSHGRAVAALSVPEILSAGEPANGYQRFGPRSIPRITGSNRRLVDFPQMMIKRQEKSWPIRLSTSSDDFPGCR